MAVYCGHTSTTTLLHYCVVGVGVPSGPDVMIIVTCPLYNDCRQHSGPWARNKIGPGPTGSRSDLRGF